MTVTANHSLFIHETLLPYPREQVFDYHARPGALQRLLPPWQDVELVDVPQTIVSGTRVRLRLRAGYLSSPFTARHVEFRPPEFFQDQQEHGPFARWVHQHEFHEHREGCLLRDRIQWALPGHRWLPQPIKRAVEKQLLRTFEYRATRLCQDLALHQKYSAQPQRILVSGASGILGRQLVPLLTTGGHEVWRLVRRPVEEGNREIFWNPEKGEIREKLPELDAVIHLAGEYIGLHRWSETGKRKVLESRIQGTELLCRTLVRQPKPPRTLLCASAVGYYGDSGDMVVVESSPPGNDFMSEVCRCWERSTEPAEKAGIRTVQMRLGVGLTPTGGGLARILKSSRLGCIRCCGDGNQYVSWISMDDMTGAILHLLATSTISGPVNIAAPTPVTNREFLATIARVAGRPLLFPVPATILRLIYGQMAEEILLSGCRTNTSKLSDSGYHFLQPNLDGALATMLGR